MSRFLVTLLGLVALIVAVATPPAQSDVAGYTFEMVNAAVRTGAGSSLAIRLVHKPSGKPVSGAVLFRTRLDMGPDNMAAMTANHQAVLEAEPGVYRFTADLTMAGGWAFRIMAKVQGEPETVQGAVIFQAKD